MLFFTVFLLTSVLLIMYNISTTTMLERKLRIHLNIVMVLFPVTILSLKVDSVLDHAML